MSTRRILGYLSLLVGVVLLIYGIYGSYKVAEAKKDIADKTEYVPGKPLRGMVQDELNRKADKYKIPVSLCYVGGVVFLVGGYLALRSER